MFEKTDQQLINKALQGNKRAWMRLLQRYEQPIYQYALRMTGNADDGKDLLQDVFISVFRNLSNYRGEGSFKSWLYSIAHYRCIEFYRRKKPTQALDDTPEPIADDACPHQALFKVQQSNQLVQAMQALPLQQKLVVELKFFAQFTFDEIADQLGESPNTIKSRLYSALGKLKDTLEVEYVR